jgi:hypothetical protein
MPRAPKGTTRVGYKNRRGQVVVRATGLPGNDHEQSIYVIVAAHAETSTARTGATSFSASARVARTGARVSTTPRW